MEIGKDEPFPLQFPLMPEIDEIAHRLPGNPHVVEELGFVVRDEFAHGLELDDDAAEREQIRLVASL